MDPKSAKLWACLITTASLALNACGTYPQPIKLTKADYPHLPCEPYSELLRARFATDSPLGKVLFWGNYGGPGCVGGKPVDGLDRLFYQHDVAYLERIKLRELRAADRLLIRQLKAVDPDSLSPPAQKYRRRTICYFRNPISRWLGKPKDVLLRTKRAPTVEWE